MIKLPLFALLLLFLGPSVLAQQPATLPPPVPQLTPAQKPDDDDVVKITTNLVQVDAVVTDSKGKLVTDLKPEEVEVFEDGRKQKISHFSFNLSETPVTAPIRDP